MRLQLCSYWMIPLICWTGCLTAQTPSHCIDCDSLDWLSITDPEQISVWETVMEDEQSQQFAANPTIALNSAALDELIALPGISEMDAYNIYQYRRRVGSFFSYYELLSIRGITPTKMEHIQSHLNLNSQVASSQRSSYKPRWRWKINTNLSGTIEQPIGYTPAPLDTSSEPNSIGPAESSSFRRNAYMGNSVRNTVRWSVMNPQRWVIGGVMDKDPGETFGRFISGYVHWQPRKWIDNLYLGHFQWSVGQGLTMWSGAALRAAPDPRYTARFARGIQKYAGAGEQRYLKGIGIHKKIGKNWKLEAIWNRRNIDHSNPFSHTGMHRTADEIASRDTFQWNSMGAHVQYEGMRWKMGAVAFHSEINTEGASSMNMGIHFLNQYKNRTWAGEISVQEGGWAWIQSLAILGGHGMDAGLQFRYFTPGFQSEFNAPLAISGKYGERGAAASWKFRWANGWAGQVRGDLYTFSEPSYDFDSQSWHSRWFSGLTSPAGSWGSWSGSWAVQNRMEDSGGGPLPKPVATKRQNLRFKYVWPLPSPWSLQLQSRWNRANGTWGQGHSLSLSTHSGAWQLNNNRSRRTGTLHWKSQYLFYSTPNFDTRIYMYEPAPRMQWSMPAFSGRGQRWLILAYWKAEQTWGDIYLGVRWGQWVRTDGEFHGSGWNEIQSDTKNDWSIHLSWGSP